MLALVILISVFALSPLIRSGESTPVKAQGNTASISAPGAIKGSLPAESTIASGIPIEPIPTGEATPDQPAETLPPADATVAEGTAGTPVSTPEEPTGTATEPASVPTQTPTGDPDAVAAVQTITRTDPAEGVIRLQWDAADGAQGYHVYWRDADALSESYTLLTTVGDTALTIRNLKQGCMYYFKIAGYRAVNGRIVDGESAVLKAGTTPTGVQSFYLASGVPTGTVLRWSANALCDGYILYRQFEGQWSRKEVLARDVTEYCDTDVIPGRAYNYRLTAYRMDESGELESAAQTVKTICGLCAPADNGTTTMLRRMYFKWKKNAYAQGYEVRYSSDNVNFKVLTDTTATSYISNRFIYGKTYYYRIYPYRYVDNGQTKIYGTYWSKSLTMTNTAYGEDAGDTYIEVSIDQQHLWYFVNGELYVSTDVVTGNYNTADTPKGFWRVNNKCSPCTLYGADYVSYVDYWIAFIGGAYGIHDASWRSTFGGQIYKGNGSHGCINTPLANVKKIYQKVTIGTPVIVY